ncbi:hypothetical protein ASG63_08520 [Methylobacterium sp. Leaf94]|uniref:hypothetical protein n=1 Tax=Methylobacterium sp. Leaf94 TaxID=1736250 RepID=UPI0007022F1A|nr:hypothetical protein [Methylobacterium sp. Leaf94]KQU17545.1 hypothetical protein ASG63_08520 [Methylobacterium sp. Leaf94]
MRALILSLLLATPAAADPIPAPGLYCPVGRDVTAIVVEPGGVVGIDSLECHGVRLAAGRLSSRRCYGNGGRPVPYDTELFVLPGGGLLHDGVRYRRQAGRCPE